ncbi:MAG: TetR/AcrR family transcriptional regulator [Pseudoxanthomonas sp.]
MPSEPQPRQAADPSPLITAPRRLTDRKRADILRAAIEEFRGHGFEATTMDRIAAAAGVSKRTVYNHFPSKEVLFAEILLQLWQKSAALVDVPYRADRPLHEQLLELLRQKFAMLDDGNFIDLARVAIAETIHSPERARDMVARLENQEEGLTRWIREASADGRLQAPNPAFAAQLLHGMVKGFAFWPQVTMGAPSLDAGQREQIAAAAVDMFLGHYAIR